jgi:hypothetical protein
LLEGLLANRFSEDSEFGVPDAALPAGGLLSKNPTKCLCGLFIGSRATTFETDNGGLALAAGTALYAHSGP